MQVFRIKCKPGEEGARPPGSEETGGRRQIRQGLGLTNRMGKQVGRPSPAGPAPL